MGQPFRARLGANESLFGPSPHAVAAMQAAHAGSGIGAAVALAVLAAGAHLINDVSGLRVRLAPALRMALHGLGHVA